MDCTDLSTRDLTTSRLRLSDELVFALQEHAGSTYCHLESPSKGRFYRVGYPEYVFLSLLDGNTTFAQAVTLSARALGSRSLSQTKAMDVTAWLLENGLARLSGDTEAGRRISDNPDRGGVGILRALNPFWIKIPLLCPERLLESLCRLVGWLLNPIMTLVGLLLIGSGIATVASHWDSFLTSSHQIFSPHNWLSLAIAWGMLKVVHELGHAVACKRYGGEVREAGLVVILLAPAAYVDVTTSWRFASKWQRIHVAAAGMFVELVVAAIAALFWSHAESVVVRHLLFNVIVMASLSTVVFNANPLMRFDGYYILADLLEIPNLASEGSRFVGQLGARVFLGRVAPTRELRGGRGWLVRVYGVAAWVWRLVVCASLLAAASVLCKGAGLVLGVVGAVSWFGRSVFQTARELTRQYYESPLVLLRAAVVATIIGSVSYGVLAWLPWPSPVTAPVIVEYTDLSIVRSRTAGFIERIHVCDGQQVEAGELLLELRNDQLQTEFQELWSTVAQVDVLQRAALGKHDAAGTLVAESNRRAQLKRLDEIQQQLDGLRVFAPAAGRVVARQLDDMLGTYIHEGAELLAVGDERRKELLLSVPQEAIRDVTMLVGHDVRFRTGNFHRYQGTLKSLEPRASRRLPHPAMSAAVGGALAVAQVDDKDRRGDVRLVEPRFPGVIALSPTTSPLLACGDRGYAILGMRSESVGQHLWIGFSHRLDQLAKLRHQ